MNLGDSIDGVLNVRWAQVGNVRENVRINTVVRDWLSHSGGAISDEIIANRDRLSVSSKLAFQRGLSDLACQFIGAECYWLILSRVVRYCDDFGVPPARRVSTLKSVVRIIDETVNPGIGENGLPLSRLLKGKPKVSIGKRLDETLRDWLMYEATDDDLASEAVRATRCAVDFFNDVRPQFFFVTQESKLCESIAAEIRAKLILSLLDYNVSPARERGERLAILDRFASTFDRIAHTPKQI